MRKLPLSGVYINRNFSLLWAGQSISVLGDAAFDAALALWVGMTIARGQVWAPFAFSGVYLAASLPALLFGPIAGVFVDRWNKRYTMLAMDATRTLLIVLLLFVTGLLPIPFVAHFTLPFPAQLLAIYTTVVLMSACGQLFGPAQVAMIGDIVPEAQRTQATGLSNATGSMGWIIGPVLGSVLCVQFGIVWAVLINALSFVVSWATILFIQVPQVHASEPQEPRQAKFLREFAEGVRFVLSDVTVTTLIGSSVLFMLGVGALNTLYLFFLVENLHASAGLYGLFVAVPAAGSTLGAILMSRFADRVGKRRMLWLALLLWGGTILILARQVQLMPSLVLLLLSGIFLAGIGAVVVPLLLEATPRALVGRVFAVMSPCGTTASMLSMFVAGYLSSTAFHHFHVTLLGMHFGFVDTMYTFVGLLSCCAGLYVLRKLSSSKEAQAETFIADISLVEDGKL